MDRASVSLNGTTYRWPLRPVVVVCVGGGDPAYFDAALKQGVIPNTARFALGGFVCAYSNDKAVTPAAIMDVARSEKGVEGVYNKASAAATFGLPPDREGDVVIIGDIDTCIGTRESEHDLSGLAGHRLCSHGAIAEAKVPFILNKPFNSTYATRAAKGGLRNFHVFDFAINGVAA